MRDPTPKEENILGLLAQGLTNEEIGHKVGLSPSTVRVHVSRIYAKIGVSSRAEAATWWTRARVREEEAREDNAIKNLEAWIESLEKRVSMLEREVFKT